MTARLYFYIAAAAGVIALGSAWHLSRVAKAEQAVHAHYAGVLAEISEKAATAERKFREAESLWRSAFEKEATDAQTRIDTARGDAAAARVERDRLLNALNRHRSAARPAEDPALTGSGSSEHGTDPLDLYARLLSGHTGELVEVGEFADQLWAKGLGCERSVDALTAALEDAK